MAHSDVGPQRSMVRKAVEQSALDRFREEAGGMECQQILRDWFPRLWKSVAERGAPDASEYRSDVEDACCVLEGIRWAFRADDLESREKSNYSKRLVEGPVGGRLWIWPTEQALQNPPVDWADKGPLNVNFLEGELTTYLEHRRLQHDRIDSAAINALLFSDLAACVAGYQSGHLIGRPNVSYILSDGDPLKLLWITPAIWMSRFVASWVMLPAISIALAAAGYQRGAILFLALWCLYLLFRLIRIPARWRARSIRRKSEEKASQILAIMGQAWRASRGSVMNPTRLKELVLAAEASGVTYRPILHTLLDRAITREPTALITGQRS